MLANATTRFPTPLPTDPWWNIFLPAMMGEHRFVQQAVERLLDDTPDSDTLVVSARALFACGDRVRAGRLAAEGIRLGGVEADRLAILYAAGGRERAPGLALSTPRRGLRAETWCDLAARALLDDDARAASEAITLALESLPEHAEARRWGRFLADAPDPASMFAAASRAPMAPGDTPPWRDACALVACERNGFVSAERWQRRYCSEGFDTVRGSALHRLREAGLARPRLCTDRELARAASSDSRAELELRADDAVSLVAEGRQARSSVRVLLAEARRFGPDTLAATARACANLAARDPALVPDTLDTLERLLPHDPARWTPWVALLGRTSRPDRSIRFARALLSDPRTPADAFLLAHDALRLCGEPDEARAFAVNAKGRPGLTRAVRHAIAARPGDPPRGLPALYSNSAWGRG